LLRPAAEARWRVGHVRRQATTELRMLDVKQKELELADQRANALIGLSYRIDKMKDAQLRERMRRAILEFKALGHDMLPTPPKESGQTDIGGEKLLILESPAKTRGDV
jgi:hypothetical protein